MSLLLTRIKRQPKLLRKLQWTLGLLLLPVVGLLLFATALVTQTIGYIPFEGEIAKAITEQHKERIKQMVTMVEAIIDAAVPPQHAVIGATLDLKMQEQIQRMIRAAQYDYPHGYFILFHVDGTVIAQGIEPENVGMNRLREKDADGVAYIQRLIEAAQNGGDFVQYKWKKRAGQDEYLKIAYTQMLRGGQWWLGSGFYVDTITEEIRAQSMNIWSVIRQVTAGLAIVLALSLLWVAYQLNRVLVQTVAEPVAQLVEGARRIAAGEYGHRVEIDSDDELKVLADAFHCMGENIGRTISDLQTAQEESKSLLEQNRAFSEKERTLIEKDRERIAQDLHDDICSDLLTLRTDCESAQRVVKDEGQRAAWAKMSQSIIEINDAVRNSVKKLYPRSLNDLGLSATLRGQLEKQVAAAGIALGFHNQAGELRVSRDLGINVLRVFQGAMTNVVKYARAHRVDVWMRCNGERLEVSMEDDGQGFDVAAKMQQKEGHYGLQIIEERVRSLGGTVQFVSKPRINGTRVEVSIPLTNS